MNLFRVVLTHLLFSMLFSMAAMATSVPEETVAVPENIDVFSHSAGTPEDNTFLNIEDSKLSNVLTDYKSRVSSQFKVPDYLRTDVMFWLKIYTTYSYLQSVIYDKEHPSVIYSIIDSRDLFQAGKGRIAIDITSKNRIYSKISQIKKALANINKHPRKVFPANSLESEVLRMSKKTSRPFNIKTAANRIRTQTGQRDQVIQGIRDAEPFIYSMETIFLNNSLPHELVSLTFLESSFNYRAVSKSNAVGVWQFMTRSGAEFLTVNKILDERRSPIKATYAAVKLFQRNYRILHDYGMSIIAYNHGHSHLERWQKRHRGGTLKDLLLDKNSPLGYASKNYYAEFLAILHAEKYRDELYGVEIKKNQDKLVLVKLLKPRSIFDISSEHGISLNDLKLYNPDVFDLKKQIPAGVRIIIPEKVN